MADDLQAQLAALQAAYNSGARNVSYEGKSVNYGSPAEMREAIAAIENQINGMAGANAPGPNSFRVRSTKGWG
jgi:hypothetical protein